MAAVINLETIRLTRDIEDTAPNEPVSAEIILFPGIRYERWEDGGDSDDATTSEIQRDRIVLSQE